MRHYVHEFTKRGGSNAASHLVNVQFKRVLTPLGQSPPPPKTDRFSDKISKARRVRADSVEQNRYVAGRFFASERS